MATHTEMSKDHIPPSGGPGAQNVPRSPHFQGQGHGSSLSKLFTEHDVVETSYHVKTNQIDLHLCDDQTLSGKSNSNAKREKWKGDSSEQSGALLISIQKLSLDHYPYHIAGLKRKLGRSDDDALFSRKQWAQQLFDFFLRNEGKKINEIARIVSCVCTTVFFFAHKHVFATVDCMFSTQANYSTTGDKLPLKVASVHESIAFVSGSLTCKCSVCCDCFYLKVSVFVFDQIAPQMEVQPT